MPKYNEYINKQKPLETVYEIENEYKTPSFEEFIKDYKADEKVNYTDLSGGSVGEVKGYGPCLINGQVIVNANCRCSPQEIEAQKGLICQKSSSRRFQAVFTNGFCLAPYFFTNHPNFLDVGGDTVDWQGKKV